QPRKHIHLGHVHLPFLDDIRREGRGHFAFYAADETVYMMAADPMVLDGIFSEFVFINTHVLCYYLANICDFVEILNSRVVFVVEQTSRHGAVTGGCLPKCLIQVLSPCRFSRDSSIS